MDPVLYQFQIGAIQDNPEYKRKTKIFGSSSGSSGSQSKIIDVEVINFGETGTSQKITPTSFALTQLINEIKKEVYSTTFPTNTISLSGGNGVEETKSLFNYIISNPKIYKSLALKKFIEAELNTSIYMKGTFIHEFLKDCDISGILQKMKNKRKNTKQDRLVVIKYSRVIYYFSVSDKKCKGIKYLDGCSIILKNDNYFELKTGSNEKYTFYCSSSQECDQWVDCIKKCVEGIEKLKIKVKGHLTGSIVKARNLAPKDLNGLSDAFAITRIERQQTKTQTVYKSLNPSWGEPLLFDITKHEGYFTMWLWDEDKFKTADFLGEVLYPLSKLPPNEEVTLWLPLAPRNSKEKITGDVQVTLKYVYSPEVPHNSPTAIFGQSLASLPSRADIKLTNGIPSFLYQLVEFFEANCLDEKGIFRENGSSIEVESLRNQLDLGQTIVCQKNSYTSYTSLFKKYFRELPEPLLTFEQYDTFLAIGKSKSTQSNSVQQCIDIFKTFPTPNLTILKLVLPFLTKISEHSNLNMMNNSNLSIIFGPSFIRQNTDNNNPFEIVDVNHAMKFIFENSPSILKAL